MRSSKKKEKLSMKSRVMSFRLPMDQWKFFHSIENNSFFVREAIADKRILALLDIKLVEVLQSEIERLKTVGKFRKCLEFFESYNYYKRKAAEIRKSYGISTRAEVKKLRLASGGEEWFKICFYLESWESHKKDYDQMLTIRNNFKRELERKLCVKTAEMKKQME